MVEKGNRQFFPAPTKLSCRTRLGAISLKLSADRRFGSRSNRGAYQDAPAGRLPANGRREMKNGCQINGVTLSYEHG
ncbi:MAG: hypothetical protein LDLANPLL_00364 [Turneriella sp.]|nr:hypothetical protein [Turneriella sp.]